MTVVLSVAGLDVLSDRLGVRLPAALRAAGGGAELPAGPARTVAPESVVAATVRRLATAPLTLELRRHLPDEMDAVVAFGTGDAVVAVRRRDEVTLRRLRPDRAVGAVLALLAPLRPAPGGPVVVPVTVLSDAVTAAGDDPNRLLVELMRRGMAGRDARSLVAANREVTALARIGVTVRDVPGPYEITVQHGRAGHRYQRPRPPDVLLSAPASEDRLVVEIDDLIHATAERAGQAAGFGVVAGRVAYGTSSS